MSSTPHQPLSRQLARSPGLDTLAGQELHLGLGKTYRLLHPLAPRASTGAVWSALWLEAQTQVAIKWLPSDTPPEVRSLQRRALDHEAHVLGRCQHPHLVRVHTIGRLATGDPVLVLERLHQPLHHRLRLRPDELPDRARVRHPIHAAAGLPMCDALSLAHQLALALQALHRSGWRHLDVKPGNLLLSPPGPLGQRLKLADLGACTSLSQARHGFLGTPGWLAPEQCLPLPGANQGANGPCFATDGRADVFAVGQVLHYLLTGQGSSWARQSHASARSGALVGVQPAQSTGCALSEDELERLDLHWHGLTPSQMPDMAAPPGPVGAVDGAQNATAPALESLATWLAEPPPPGLPQTPSRGSAATTPLQDTRVNPSPLHVVMRRLCALQASARYVDMPAAVGALHDLRVTWLRHSGQSRSRFSGNDHDHVCAVAAPAETKRTPHSPLPGGQHP